MKYTIALLLLCLPLAGCGAGEDAAEKARRAAVDKRDEMAAQTAAPSRAIIGQWAAQPADCDTVARQLSVQPTSVRGLGLSCSIGQMTDLSMGHRALHFARCDEDGRELELSVDGGILSVRIGDDLTRLVRCADIGGAG